MVCGGGGGVARLRGLRAKDASEVVLVLLRDLDREKNVTRARFCRGVLPARLNLIQASLPKHGRIDRVRCASAFLQLQIATATIPTQKDTITVLTWNVGAKTHHFEEQRFSG